jgi:rubrerythrin
MLSKALQVEVETSAFYRKLVQEMEGDARTMFARFLEIEDGHIAVVQAELDYISQTGFWFDFQEFDMEY